jgi:hypothetical protein
MVENTKKYKWIDNELTGPMLIEDTGQIDLLPKKWLSATTFSNIFGMIGIFISSSAVEAKEQLKTTAKRKIKRQLIEVPSELNRAGIRVFRPSPDPFKRAIPGIRLSKEAFNSILINNAFLACQYDKLHASQLAYLKNLSYYFHQPVANEGMSRLAESTQIEAEKRILQKAYANSFVPNLSLNEVDLLILSAKTGAIGAISGYVAYSLLNLIFSSSKREALALTIRSGFDPITAATTTLWGAFWGKVGDAFNKKKDDLKDNIKEKLDLGNILDSITGNGKKKQSSGWNVANPVIFAIAAIFALATYLSRGGKLKDIPGGGPIVEIFQHKPTVFQRIGSNIRWLYNPTELQGVISWTVSGVTIYLLLKRYPMFHKGPLDAINSAMNSILELTKLQFDKLTNMVQDNYVDSKNDMVKTRAEAAQRAQEGLKAQAEEIRMLKQAIQSGQSENSALREIYGEAQVTSSTIQNSLHQCRNDAKDQMVYEAAVANTQQNMLKSTEVVTQQAFENAVQNQLKQGIDNTEAIVARIDNRYPNPAPIPPLSDGLRDYKIKVVEDKQAIDRAAGGTNAKK